MKKFSTKLGEPFFLETLLSLKQTISKKINNKFGSNLPLIVPDLIRLKLTYNCTMTRRIKLGLRWLDFANELNFVVLLRHIFDFFGVLPTSIMNKSEK